MVATQIFLEFSPRKLGKMNPFWRAYFSNGLKPPTSNGFFLFLENSRCDVNFHQLGLPLKPAIQLPKNMVLSYVFQVESLGISPPQKKLKEFRWVNWIMTIFQALISGGRGLWFTILGSRSFFVYVTLPMESLGCRVLGVKLPPVLRHRGVMNGGSGVNP